MPYYVVSKVAVGIMVERYFTEKIAKNQLAKAPPGSYMGSPSDPYVAKAIDEANHSANPDDAWPVILYLS